MVVDDIDLLTMPQLPNSPEIEQAVLGCLFAEKDKPEVAMVILTELEAGDFYNSLHQEAFKAAKDCFDHNRPLDEGFVTDQLRRNLPHIEASGELIPALKFCFNGSGHLDKMIEELKIKATNRRIVTRFFKLIGDKDTLNTTELQDGIASMLSEASKKQCSQTESTLSEILPNVIHNVEERMERGNELVGCPTGFKGLDNIIGGLQPTRLITLCAKTGIGKTSFALQIASHVALEEEKTVLFASMEMSKEEVVQRLLCQQGALSGELIRRGVPTMANYERLLSHTNSLNTNTLIIDDAPQTLSSLRAKCMRVVAQKGALDLLVVDYLGLLRGERNGNYQGNRYQEVSAMVRGLKDLALELKIPVLCLAQPNRNADARGDNALRLSDLKDSGEIEQASDIALFLNRKGKETNAELVVAKNRTGPLGKVCLKFLPRLLTYEQE